MRFLFDWIHENIPIVIVFGIAAIITAAWIVTSKGAVPIIENIGKYNVEIENADILVYDGMDMTASMVSDFAREHYEDGFTILVDATTVSSSNYASLNIGSNTKYLCTVTMTVDKVSKVTFTKRT